MFILLILLVFGVSYFWAEFVEPVGYHSPENNFGQDPGWRKTLVTLKESLKFILGSILFFWFIWMFAKDFLGFLVSAF